MNPPHLPPLYRDQRNIDADHLKLLAVFHYVLAGFAVVGLLFLFLHWAMFNAFASIPMKDGQSGPPPEFFSIFIWFYLFFGTVIVASGAANLISGRCIQQRRGRIFSLVVAGMNCLCFPLGTVLGVFTFVLLLRDSVTQIYEANLDGHA